MLLSFLEEGRLESSISLVNVWKLHLVAWVLNSPECWDKVERSEMVITGCWTSLIWRAPWQPCSVQGEPCWGSRALPLSSPTLPTLSRWKWQEISLDQVLYLTEGL